MAEGIQNTKNADRLLFGAVFLMVAFGILMVYSASMVYAFRIKNNPFHFVSRQMIFAAVGMAFMIAARYVDFRYYRRLTHLLLFMSLAGLIMTLTPLGVTVNGASRWLRIGPVFVQPAEGAKISLVLWLAYSLAKKKEKIKTFSAGFLPHLIIAGVLILLCLAQPDFGTAVIIGLITFILLFVAGVKLGYILGAGILLLPAAYAVLASSPYRLRRIEAFLDPFRYRFGVGYQISESLISFGAGGTGGTGIGDGRQKLLFLPEAHNDFISAIIGEELGMVGICLMILIFCIIVWRGYRIAVKAPDAYGSYVAFGISALIALQAFIHLAVTMGLLPTKGINLPLVSYGGSSLVATLFSIGMLLNISASRTVKPSASKTGAGPDKPGRETGVG